MGRAADAIDPRQLLTETLWMAARPARWAGIDAEKLLGGALRWLLPASREGRQLQPPIDGRSWPFTMARHWRRGLLRDGGPARHDSRRQRQRGCFEGERPAAGVRRAFAPVTRGAGELRVWRWRVVAWWGRVFRRVSKPRGPSTGFTAGRCVVGGSGAIRFFLAGYDGRQTDSPDRVSARVGAAARSDRGQLRRLSAFGFSGEMETLRGG